MAYQFPAFNFSRILLWKNSEPPGCEEGFRDDAELLGLGLMSAVDLASGTRGRPGRMWALNFARPLTVGEVEAAIARVRGLTTRPIYEIGPTPSTLLPSGPNPGDAAACSSQLFCGPRGGLDGGSSEDLWRESRFDVEQVVGPFHFLLVWTAAFGRFGGGGVKVAATFPGMRWVPARRQ